MEATLCPACDGDTATNGCTCTCAECGSTSLTHAGECDACGAENPDLAFACDTCGSMDPCDCDDMEPRETR